MNKGNHILITAQWECQENPVVYCGPIDEIKDSGIRLSQYHVVGRQRESSKNAAGFFLWNSIKSIQLVEHNI